MMADHAHLEFKFRQYAISTVISCAGLFYPQGEKVVSFVGRVMDYKHHITFKGLQETVDKLNRNLEKRPIPGTL